MSLVIKVENLSKRYQLGEIGTGYFAHDFKRFTAKLFGKENLNSPINEKLTNGEYWALKDVSFEVKEGEVLGIIGKNGAGKSTLLKILSKVTAPTSGQIKIKGRIASLLEVGTGFHPELSGRENIFLNGAILGMTKSEIKNKFDDIVDFSGVEKFIDTPVKRYSSGMYVRLAFAVAAHLEPEILIVDEVLAVGDAEFQKKCLGKMKDVAGQGRTVLFVSHNMTAIRDLCNTGIYLINGSISAGGMIDDVVKSYALSNRHTPTTTGNLQNMPHRVGNGKLQFTHISFLDNSNNPLQQVGCGEGVKIELRFKTTPGEHYNPLHFSIAVLTEEGLPVAHLSNSTANGVEFKLSDTNDSNHRVTCAVQSLPLQPGKYILELFCSDLHQIFDHIENAAELTIEPRKFYESTKFPPKNKGAVLLQNFWTI